MHHSLSGFRRQAVDKIFLIRLIPENVLAVNSPNTWRRIPGASNLADPGTGFQISQTGESSPKFPKRRPFAAPDRSESLNLSAFHNQYSGKQPAKADFH